MLDDIVEDPVGEGDFMSPVADTDFALKNRGGRVRIFQRSNGRIAAALCVVPGLGQLYNGQPRKAIFFLLSTLLSLGPAVLLITFGERFGHALLDGHHLVAFLLVAFTSVLIFLVLFVLGLFLWASSASDARRTALAMRSGAQDEAAQTTFFRL